MPRGMASYVGHLLRLASRPNNYAQKMLKASSEDVSYLLAFLLKKMCYPSVVRRLFTVTIISAKLPTLGFHEK